MGATNFEKRIKRNLPSGTAVRDPRDTRTDFAGYMAGKSKNPDKNWKSLNNSLGQTVDSHVAGSSIMNVPNKKKTLL